MKIYWIDPDGNPPPQNARFFMIPFEDQSPQEILSFSLFSKLPPSSPLSILEHQFFPSKENWIQCIEKTLEKINQGDILKAVLARKCTFKCKTPPNPLKILSHLKQSSQNATLFCLLEKNRAFLGASPETLFKREKNQLFTEALAGTTYRGKTIEEDTMLEKELLKDPTKREEIAFVQAFIKKALQPLCKDPIHFSSIGIKKTQNVQHLHQTANATLKDNISDLDIAKALHPTPALCGTPQKKAREWILQNEPFERGLYGGVIGWSTQEQAHFIVAIRSALIERENLHLYTGCGIVKGSTPEKEWEELNHKMKLFKPLFKKFFDLISIKNV